MKDVDFVIEAVTENEDVKKAIFAKLDKVSSCLWVKLSGSCKGAARNVSGSYQGVGMVQAATSGEA